MRKINRIRNSKIRLEVLIERGEQFIKFRVRDTAGNIDFKFEGKATGSSIGDYFGISKEMDTGHIEVAVSNDNHPNGLEIAYIGDKYDASIFDAMDDTDTVVDVTTEKITCQCPRCKK